MADHFPTPDEIINGTYKPPIPDQKISGHLPVPAGVPTPAPRTASVDGKPIKLDAEQQKAIEIVLSGMAYAIVGIKPTYGDKDQPKLATGSDFFTAARGDIETMRACSPHLAGVLERLYTNRGWV